MTKVNGHEAGLVPIDSVKPYKGNARVGNVDVIRESLRANGQYRPLVVRRSTNEILAGNHTWKAAKQEKLTEIWVTYIECDAQTARRINLVDNKSAEHGGYDRELLLAQLGALPDLKGTGWSTDELTALLGETPQAPGDDVPDDDDYETEPGVVVMCQDKDQQQTVLRRLQKLADDERSEFWGAQLKLVAL